jgi:ferredoxin
LLAGAKVLEDILGVRGTTPIDPGQRGSPTLATKSRYLCAGEESARGYSHGQTQARERCTKRQGIAGMAGKLKIHVDQDKCQGHARCKSLAPELFELDEFGNAHEIGDGSVPPGLEDKAWLAQANCPEIAIDVTEE